jgi:hypothetical protein
MLAAVTLGLVLSGCGGGGGGGGGDGSSSSGGGVPGANKQPSAVDASNKVVLNVDQGLRNVANLVKTSVTVCVPGTSQCQTIDNVQVDTGSFGLRLIASSASAVAGTLPQVPGFTALASCARFADGFAFGSVRLATVRLAGETTAAGAPAGVPIQLIGDSAFPNAPATCSNNGRPENTVDQIGANGILGIGTSPVDCGNGCAASVPSTGFYYNCSNPASCIPATVPVSQQIGNPVARFLSNNNGVIVQMPPIGTGGASAATGTLIFGIGTQSNNQLDADVKKIGTDSAGDFLSVNYSNMTFNSGFTDTGSNGLFFNDPALPLCTGSTSSFYCPSSTLTKTATIVGTDAASTSVSFVVANANMLFNTSGAFAFNDLAGSLGNGQFDFGLPFFYGRHVAVAIVGQPTPAGNGPFVAF